MREKRHTSYGGRADQAADSPVKAKPARSAAAEKQQKYRDNKKRALRLVTGALPNVTPALPNVTKNVTVTQAQNVTPSLPPSLPNVTPFSDLIARLAAVERENKSLVMRLDAMERWGEALEARFPVRRTVAPTVPTSLAPPSVSNVAATGRVARRYPIMIKGNRVTVTEGQAYSCYGVQGIAPWLDQDGQPIPE